MLLNLPLSQAQERGERAAALHALASTANQAAKGLASEGERLKREAVAAGHERSELLRAVAAGGRAGGLGATGQWLKLGV